MRERSEQEQKELLWQSISLLTNVIKAEKELKAKPLREFNRLFQKDLGQYVRFSKDKQINTNEFINLFHAPTKFSEVSERP